MKRDLIVFAAVQASYIAKFRGTRNGVEVVTNIGGKESPPAPGRLKTTSSAESQGRSESQKGLCVAIVPPVGARVGSLMLAAEMGVKCNLKGRQEMIYIGGHFPRDDGCVRESSHFETSMVASHQLTWSYGKSITDRLVSFFGPETRPIQSSGLIESSSQAWRQSG
jgi:hypothetical protein